MKLLLKPLMRLHSKACETPYYHLSGYMLRDWILGYRSPERNGDNPVWKQGNGPKPGGALYRWLCRHIAIRAHTILRSDNDRHLHDHPGWSLSIVLEGGYWEVCEPNWTAVNFPSSYEFVLQQLDRGLVGERDVFDRDYLACFNIHWRGPGAIVLRKATDCHRLILPRGTVAKSIFAMGKKSNSWGFKTPEGKVYWRTYLGLDKEQS
jgi:hypothetical protein